MRFLICLFGFERIVLDAYIGFELVCYFEIAYARHTHARQSSEGGGRGKKEDSRLT